MEGSVSFGQQEMTMGTACAVEIEEHPARTYKHNFPHVNVVHMGVSRFNASVIRMQKLKVSLVPNLPYIIML